MLLIQKKHYFFVVVELMHVLLQFINVSASGVFLTSFVLIWKTTTLFQTSLPLFMGELHLHYWLNFSVWFLIASLLGVILLSTGYKPTPLLTQSQFLRYSDICFLAPCRRRRWCWGRSGGLCATVCPPTRCAELPLSSCRHTENNPVPLSSCTAALILNFFTQ